MLVDDGIMLLKYWLSVDQKEQEERFAERAADPLKRWKLSPIDLKAREQYAEYGRARDAMFKATHTKHAPWFVVDFDDQRRGRLNLIRHLLDQVPDKRVPDKPVDLPPPSGQAPAREVQGPSPSQSAGKVLSFGPIRADLLGLMRLFSLSDTILLVAF